MFKVKITSPSVLINNVIHLSNLKNLCTSWHSFTDLETKIVSYHFSLCLYANQQNCSVKRQSVNNQTSLCIEKPPIIEGQKYIIQILATNEVGLVSTAASKPFTLDNSPPDIGVITVSNTIGKQFDFISTSLLTEWNGFIDRESGIKEYRVCVGTEPGLCNITNNATVGNVFHHTWYNLSLLNSEDYFVSIWSINNAGLSSDYISSEPFSVDTTG